MEYKKVLYVLLLVGIISVFSFTTVSAENAHRDNIDVMLENSAYFSSILAYELPLKEVIDQILEDPKLVFVVTKDPSILKIALGPVKGDFSNQDSLSNIISEDSLLHIDQELAFLAEEEPLNIGSTDESGVVDEDDINERMQAIDSALNEEEINIEINQDQEGVKKAENMVKADVQEVVEKIIDVDQPIIEPDVVKEETTQEVDQVIEPVLSVSEQPQETAVQEVKKDGDEAVEIVEVVEESQEQQVVDSSEADNIKEELPQENTEQIVMFNSVPRRNVVPELDSGQTNISRSLNTSLVSSRNGQPVDLKGPLSIELTLRYNREENTIVLVGQRIVNAPPPKYRDPTIGANQFVLQCEDSNGEVLGSYPLLNPSMMRVEWVNPENVKAPTLFDGEHFKIPESEFFIVIPFFEDLRSVRLLKPYPQSQEVMRSINLHRAPQQAGEVMETVGQTVINHEAISAFIEGRAIELMR